ncbi:MAG TPA: DUF4440 domain-containing protein [Candidatus Limnocylindrales bacterium]|nr:DUF4440 domain-containing protein [Candidatus Limnocylindrales bacterium]
MTGGGQMRRPAFVTLLARLRDAWNAGSAAGAAACFADAVDYADPTRYRFASRAELLPFFEPPTGGHQVTWHRVLFDETTGTGVVEYTYRGHHRYHGAALVEVDDEGLISSWREYQHLADDREFEAFVAGPG